MQITIPDEAVRGIDLTEQEARIDLACGLFADGKVSLGRAAEIADVPQADFQVELGRRRIPIHYSEQDLLDDLDTLGRLGV